ncbi:nucleotide exchange factor GrpE [Imperialibacter roseus]|uniref:Protein GrpE n=1 Tax=Imperialibacter roseus TaxID=1324217 RepID=A0ABZ0IPZ1_9BACT|nr:nucleotide exchange factor GrpE [Imperialibacter roseus]WOK06766.1 nucleotide exchange factor GrpE [Imperialibacter roseus]
MAKKNVEENKETIENSVEEQVLDGENANASEESTDNGSDVAEDEVTVLKRELEESKDKYLRLYSEFDNYRRRTAKERVELIKTAGEDVLAVLIPVVDDFERAKKSIDGQEIEASVKEGVDLIYNKLIKVLDQKGLKAMEVETGHEFNPELHEAVTQFPAPDDSLKGRVIDVVEKGYVLGDKVIRFAKVVTGA